MQEQAAKLILDKEYNAPSAEVFKRRYYGTVANISRFGHIDHQA